MTTGTTVVNIVCGYAPQVGRAAEEKEKFLVLLGDVFTKDEH